MVHHCCSKQKVKRGLWSPEEDEKLVNYITTHGHSSWSSVPKHAGLQRCGKSCRLRWINYLRPDLKRGSFNEEEERTIIEVHRILGNRWAQIAKHLPGRTDNEVKNFWNSCIKKKLLAQGLDPNTHNLLSSHQKMAKKNNTYNNVTKCTTTYRRMPPNSTTLVFSGDNDSPVNIIRQAIQSCFPSRNNGRLQNNVADSSKDDHNQKIAVNDSSKPDSNLVIASNVNNFSYMVDESSIWNDPIIIDEMEQQSSAQTEVLVQSQPSILSDHGVDEYGFIKADMNQKTYIQNQPSNRTTDNNNPFGNLLAHLNNQCLDDTLTTFNSSSFDVGFGDYSSIIMSGSLYGDMGSMAMDQVAWGNC